MDKETKQLLDAKETNQLLDDIDTAFAVLNIGRNHGITPQAARCCREVWQRTRDKLGYEGDLTNAFKNCRCD